MAWRSSSRRCARGAERLADGGLALRAQDKLRGGIGPPGERGDQAVPRRPDRVLQPAHEGLLVEAGLDGGQELDGGTSRLLPPVATVPQQAQRGRDRRHWQAEIAIKVIDAGAV